MLIVSLPLTPQSEVDHLVCMTPERITHSGRSRVQELAQLPPQSEVVGVIPWACLSWTELTVPQSALRLLESKASGTHNPKAQHLIQGLLEEQLLCDASDLHWIAKKLDPQPEDQASLASPDLSSSKVHGAMIQIGYCSKSWLRMALQTLEAVDLIPHQLVPEMEPTTGSQGPRLYALNAKADITFVLCTRQGVQAFPRPAMGAFSHLKDPSLQIFCEPSAIDWVSSLLHQEASLQTTPQRLQASSQSVWDFAHGEWDQGPFRRTTRRLKGAFRALLTAPEWRLARSGLVLALLVQIFGLNFWAWHLRAEHQEALQSEARILKSTFPKVQLVVDAPLQMTRELNRLKQNLGEPSLGDFEHLLEVMRQLHTLSPATSLSTPKTSEIQGISFAHQTLKWHYNPSTSFTSVELRLPTEIGSKGYQLQKIGSEMVLSWSDAP